MENLISIPLLSKAEIVMSIKTRTAQADKEADLDPIIFATLSTMLNNEWVYHQSIKAQCNYPKTS